MIGEHALEHRAQVGRGPQVAAFVALALGEAGPLAEHAPAAHRAAEHEGGTAAAVVGAQRAVDRDLVFLLLIVRIL